MKGLIVLASAAFFLSSAVSAQWIRVYNMGIQKGTCAVDFEDRKLIDQSDFDCHWNWDELACYFIGSHYPVACEKLK
ncbi:hypothetical protein BGX31_003528, partial [Mortierella sp. GBA43]